MLTTPFEPMSCRPSPVPSGRGLRLGVVLGLAVGPLLGLLVGSAGGSARRVPAAGAAQRPSPGKGGLPSFRVEGAALSEGARSAAAAAAAADGDDPRPPMTWAALINGGGSAVRSYLSHLHHLEDMVTALEGRGIPRERIAIFSADGEDPGKDLTARSVDPSDFWLIDGTAAGRALNPPELTNTVWEGVTLRPARLAELRKWFAGMSEVLRPGDTLAVFVTDHGNRNTDDPDNGLIVLWNEALSVLEFRALLGYLQPGVRVVSIMSQCYSGAFAESMVPLRSRVPDGDVCGFYSTTGDREAYGCYPEGRDRDRIGYAFRFIDAMDRHASLDDVQAAVLVSDTTPDVPVRTSDLFLERILKEEAARRGTDQDDLVDQQLSLAWKGRAAWEPEIRLLDRIGSVYGTFSPRSLAELKPRIERLDALAGELDTYQERWKLSLNDLRNENLLRFEQRYPAWKEKLDQQNLNLLDPAAKKSLLPELLAAIKEFTAGQPDITARLRELHETYGDASEAEYRVEVRLAALLRMRALLIRIAGTEFLLGAGEGEPGSPSSPMSPSAGADPASRPASMKPGELAAGIAPATNRLAGVRRALETLEACEKTPLGKLDPSRERPVPFEAPDPLPPFDQDLAAVRRAIPSWLGVRFRSVEAGQRERLDLARGAVLVDQIYPGTPAQRAGIEPGDFILGPSGAHFAEPNQLREWTMTSPRDTPLALDLWRDGTPITVTVSLAALPTQLPGLPAPPSPGEEAPPLASLEILRWGNGARSGTSLAALEGRRHMLFFWATWCVPCKSSVPEVMAWSRRTGVPVVAISDEDGETIMRFLGTWTKPFPTMVASDGLRRVTVAYGVSGTPTFVLVEESGKIEWRHVGYSPKEHLGIPGWTWSGGAE